MKVLRVGTLSPVRTFHPREIQDSGSALCAVQVFETPFAPPVDAKSSPQPLLFAGPLKQESSGETPVLSGQVRSGARFSDGTAVTAQHVALCLNQVEALRRDSTVRAEGDRVIFQLERPHPRFELFLSNHFCSVALERGRDLLGTGAFRHDSASPAGTTKLVKNKHYDAPVAFDEVLFQHIPAGAGDDHSALMQALERGEVDLSTDLSRSDVSELKNVRKWIQPGVSTATLNFNTADRILGDPQVRKAIAYAIDRDALTKVSYDNALAFTATGLLPPLMGSFRDNIRHNPELARKILGDRKIALPLRLKMLLPWASRTYMPRPQQVAEAIIEQLKKIDVIVEPVPTTDVVDFYRRNCAPGYQLGLIGWVADSLDVSEFLDVLLASEAVPQSGKAQASRANFSRWSDAEADKLLASYRRDGSPEALKAVLHRVAEMVPLLPISYGPSTAVHSWKLRNFTPAPIAYHNRFAKLDLV